MANSVELDQSAENESSVDPDQTAENGQQCRPWSDCWESEVV